MSQKRSLEDILEELRGLNEQDSGGSTDSSSEDSDQCMQIDRQSISSDEEFTILPQKLFCKDSTEANDHTTDRTRQKRFQTSIVNFDLSQDNHYELIDQTYSSHNDEDNAEPSTTTTTFKGKLQSNHITSKRGHKRALSTSGFISSLAINTIGREETSADGTVWKIIQPCETSGRREAQNVLKEVQGPTSYSKRNICEGSAISAWRLIFTNQMVDHIRKCTEAEARRRLSDKQWSVSIEELHAMIAIMYARGAYGAKNFPVSRLWSTVWGPPFFAQTMPRDRYIEILRFLRFDIKEERSKRLQTDKFALASSTWNSFIENSKMCYEPGENLVVDEQLLASKARCPFAQYIPTKPDKFGIKFWLLVCADSKYILNGFPYTGTDKNRSADQHVHENVVMKLSENYLGKGRNITTDNYFTSLKLCKMLKSRATNLVGMLRRDRREVPPSAKLGKQPLHSTIVFTNGQNITLTAYQGKRNKNILVLSSVHPSVNIGDDAKSLPETVDFYNHTKYGVADQMIRLYSTKSGSRRWPMHVFFNILDMSAINAWIIYKEVVTKPKLCRRDFILRLCDELRGPYIANRNVTHSLVPNQCMENTSEHDSTAETRRMKCRLQRFCKGNVSKNQCSSCRRAVCGKCSTRDVKCADC